jgi:heme-degrading monooxygenase HmoA
MIAVIFEATPGAAERDEYLAIAAELRPLLDGIDGFISIERFESIYEPGKLLSLSFWRDEAAVARWRTMDQHRAAQAKGHARIFDTYRIRVAQVTRDYDKERRGDAPADSRAANG